MYVYMHILNTVKRDIIALCACVCVRVSHLWPAWMFSITTTESKVIFKVKIQN